MPGTSRTVDLCWLLGVGWDGVSLVPTPRGDKSALLFLGLVWANSRTLRVSRQRCKFGEDIEYLQCPASSSCEIGALSIATLPAQVGKLRHRAFHLPLTIKESMAKTD